jgi:hypothetical protein
MQFVPHRNTLRHRHNAGYEYTRCSFRQAYETNGQNSTIIEYSAEHMHGGVGRILEILYSVR